MVVWMIELISLAASNSLAVFCFCNVIIAFLVVGGSKTSSECDEITRPSPSIVCLNQSSDEKESSVSIDMIYSQNEDEEEEEEEEEEEDELRKRVEEFIEKTNRGWEAEKMNRYSTTSLIQ